MFWFGRIRTIFQKLIGSSRILLFYSCLPDKRLVVHPNKRTLVCSPCISDKVLTRGETHRNAAPALALLFCYSVADPVLFYPRDADPG
jgi:hypothetical protein